MVVSEKVFTFVADGGQTSARRPSHGMKIQNFEESSIVRVCIILNDILLTTLSYWIVFACRNSTEAALAFPADLKMLIALGGLTAVLTGYLLPPVFTQRFVFGNDILSRSVSVAALQGFIVLVMMAILRDANSMRGEVICGSCLLAALLTAERIGLYKWIAYIRKRGRNLRHIVLAGQPQMLLNIYNTFQNKSLGFAVQGIFTNEPLPEEMDTPVLGPMQQVTDYLHHHPEVSDVYVVPAHDDGQSMIKIFRYCEKHTIRFYALPVFLDVLPKRMELSHVDTTMVLSVRNEPLQELTNRFIKRTFDIAVSALFLLTVFPIVYLVAGIIIKCQSRGPIIFKQKRNGLNGREFYCLKFRSMHVNKQADTLQATEHDPRKFRFGDLMRRTNIDELPQFINVLRGDMSLVGPRPHMLKHTEEYSRLISSYMIRHLVKPGITGWAQTNGFRGRTETVADMERRVKADIWYVENWSFGLDLRIMWRTVVTMLFRQDKNAY